MANLLSLVEHLWVDRPFAAGSISNTTTPVATTMLRESQPHCTKEGQDAVSKDFHGFDSVCFTAFANWKLPFGKLFLRLPCISQLCVRLACGRRYCS
jgi:hypothetical protein